MDETVFKIMVKDDNGYNIYDIFSDVCIIEGGQKQETEGSFGSCKRGGY